MTIGILLGSIIGTIWGYAWADYYESLKREKLEHENAVLCAFINREMKMTASDPRIAEICNKIS